MNILLVDDEADILDGIIAAIDFEALGIHNVYAASNAAHAKKIMESYPIDIIITDIEMPNESGLALLEWINQNELPVVSILCTAYAYFDYAQKALSSKAFSYYLKPIYYEDLSKIIASAVQEVERRRMQSDYIRYGKRWGNLQTQIKSFFWKELILGGMGKEPADLAYLEDTYGISYPKEDRFCAVLIDLVKTGKNADETAGVIVLMERIYACSGRDGLMIEAAFSPRSSVIYVVCKTDDPASFLRKLIQESSAELGMDINCYYLEQVPYLSLIRAFHQTENIYRDDFSLSNQVVNVSQYHHENRAYNNSRLKDWEYLLSQNKTAEIYTEAERMLKSSIFVEGARYADRGAFRLDIIQLVNVVLYKHGIRSGELLQQIKESEIYENSGKSIENMMRFVRYVLEAAMECVAKAADINDAINVALKYIDDNISSDLSRESIAKLMYLNPDYFSRLFKKRMGCSVGTYIRDRRLELAKELLVYSNKSIGMIAYDIGYESMSYFSQIFKKYTGVRPKEYRMKKRASPRSRGEAEKNEGSAE